MPLSLSLFLSLTLLLVSKINKLKKLIEKQEKSQINNLTLQLKELEKKSNLAAGTK